MAYLFFHTLFRLLSLLPLRLLYVLSDATYPVVHHVLKYRRDIVRRNLAEAFPEKSGKERDDIERRFYHFFCDLFAENVKLFSVSRAQMMRRMTFGGLDEMRESFDGGAQLVFAYLGHVGNWEWVASLQYWLPDIHCTQIYHPLRNRVSQRIFLRLREQYGGECIPMRKTLRRLVGLKREGRKVVVGFISDQQPRWDSIHHFTPFLNHDTAVFTGTEHIAKALGAPVFYGHVTRVRRGHYHCEFRRMTSSPADFPDFELTDLYMQMLEADIRANPHLWLWTHKRWSRTKERWLERQKEGEKEKEEGSKA